MKTSGSSSLPSLCLSPQVGMGCSHPSPPRGRQKGGRTPMRTHVDPNVNPMWAPCEAHAEPREDVNKQVRPVGEGPERQPRWKAHRSPPEA